MRGINSGHPAIGGTRDTGGLFFGSFLWASKEMNRRIKRIASGGQWVPPLGGPVSVIPDGKGGLVVQGLLLCHLHLLDLGLRRAGV